MIWHVLIEWQTTGRTQVGYQSTNCQNVCPQVLQPQPEPEPELELSPIGIKWAKELEMRCECWLNQKSVHYELGHRSVRYFGTEVSVARIAVNRKPQTIEECIESHDSDIASANRSYCLAQRSKNIVLCLTSDWIVSKALPTLLQLTNRQTDTQCLRRPVIEVKALLSAVRNRFECFPL